MPRVIGGRYGISSKEFTPGMVCAVYDELTKDKPRPRFTVGINDDVTHLSLPVGEEPSIMPEGTVGAVFYGLGSDGTVGANKNTIKILGSQEGTFAQGYFVYDSKKSGSRTVSHLRFGPKPIQAPYLVLAGDLRRLPPHVDPRTRRHPRVRQARRGAADQRPVPARGRSGTPFPRTLQEGIIDQET